MRPFQRRSAIRTRYGRVFGRQRALSGGSSYIRTRPELSGLGDIPVYGAQPPFNAYVEAWRDLVTQMAGDLPVEFLMAWMDIESNGNPCSWTKYAEAGIFQLMAGDNIAQGGTTLADQHPVPPCTAGVQTNLTFSSLTSDQAREQVRAGVQYVNYCRAQAHAALDAAGVSWDESSADFWSLVKMVHVSPAAVKRYVTSDIATWDDFVSAANAGGIPASWTTNATEVGLFGTGGGSALGGSSLLVLAALGLGLLYLWSRTR